jgi:hypothetical protein
MTADQLESYRPHLCRTTVYSSINLNHLGLSNSSPRRIHHVAEHEFIHATFTCAAPIVILVLQTAWTRADYIGIVRARTIERELATWFWNGIASFLRDESIARGQKKRMSLRGCQGRNCEGAESEDDSDKWLHSESWVFCSEGLCLKVLE